jgi:hypothetical protein
MTWLGAVPAHWTLLRAKRLFREVDERSKTGKEELLSVSHLTGVTPRRLKTVTMFMAESNVGHKVCRPGDLVINTLSAWMAALGVSRHIGLVSPAYGVYRPIDGGGILPAYGSSCSLMRLGVSDSWAPLSRPWRSSARWIGFTGRCGSITAIGSLPGAGIGSQWLGWRWGSS